MPPARWRCIRRSGEENSDKIQALKKALQSDDVKKYVDETYKGAVVTVF